MKLTRRLANLDWMASVLLPVTIVMMEVYWFYPWLVWLGKSGLLNEDRTPLSLGAVIFLMGGAFVTTRYLLGRDKSIDVVRWGIVLIGLLVLYTVLRSEYHAGFGLMDGGWFVHTGRLILDSFTNASPFIIALPAAAYLWWRGISRGRTPPYVSDIYRTLMVGIGAFVLLIIVWRISLGEGSLEGMASTVAPDLAAFFFFGLAGLALANLRGIRQKTLPDETIRSFNRRWLPVLVLVVGSIVLVGVGVSALFSPEFMTFLSNLMGSVGRVLQEIIRYILIPISYIAAAFVYVGMWLLSLIRSTDPPQFPADPAGAAEDEPEEIPLGDPIPEHVIMVLKWVLFAIAVIVVVYFIRRAVSRIRASRAGPDTDEFSESLFSWGGFRADLATFLSAIWQRLWRRRKPADEHASRPYWHDQEEAETGRLGIREIYQRLLWQGFRFGVRHRDWETPQEYQRRLAPAVPEGTRQLGELTSLYEDVRYGEIDLSETQVDRANGIWQAFRELMRRPGVHCPPGHVDGSGRGPRSDQRTD